MYSYYMFYKPYGCVCARRDDSHPTVIDYFKELNNPNLSPVGRLDKETEGLLIITDDGKYNQMMTHPENKIEKKYEFIVMGIIDDTKRKQLENGILLKGTSKNTSPAKIYINGTKNLSDISSNLHPNIQNQLQNNRPDTPVTIGNITITEGKKHQIRRMMRAIDCFVIHLKRISMGDICLDETLLPGEWTNLSIDCVNKQNKTCN